MLPVGRREERQDVHVGGVVGRQGRPDPDEQEHEAGDEGAERREAMGEEGAHARALAPARIEEGA